MSTVLPVQILQGTSAVITIYLSDGDSGKPRDLTAVTEIIASVPAAAGGCVLAKLSLSQITILSPATSGGFNINFTAAMTALMAVSPGAFSTSGTFTALNLSVLDPTDLNWKPRLIQINNALNIQTPSC